MIHLGIIGCGRVTTMFHLNAIESLEDFNVVSVSDVDEPRMSRVKNSCGADNAYINYKELFRSPEVDAVVINTPPRFHEKMVLEALESGKHVLCEKPLAQTVEGCIRIKNVQRSKGLVVLPAHNYAFTPSLIKMEDMYNSGEIGEIKKVEAYFENNLKLYRSRTNFRVNEGKGVVEDVLPHIMSVTSPFTGNPVDYEHLTWWCKSYDVCDNLRATLITESDLKVNCSMSWTTIIPRFSLNIYGSEANIKTDLMISPYTITVDKEGVKNSYKEKGLSWYLDLVRFKHPSFQGEYNHFKRLIEGQTTPRITIDDEIAIIRMVEKVSKKLEGGEVSGKSIRY
jgi:predicted dehydrogenase